MHNIQYTILNIVYRICSANIKTLNSICNNTFSRPIPFHLNIVCQRSPEISFTVLLKSAHFTKLFAHVDLRYPLRWEYFDWNDFRMISYTQDPPIRFGNSNPVAVLLQGRLSISRFKFMAELCCLKRSKKILNFHPSVHRTSLSKSKQSNLRENNH